MSNYEELQQILKRIEEGADISALEGFNSKQTFVTITTPHYNPFAHCDEDGIRAWHLFGLFLKQRGGWDAESIAAHVEYLLQHQFKTPSEWLGEEGEQWRQQCRMRKMRPKIIKDWEAFFAKHDGKSLSDIEALLSKAGGSETPSSDTPAHEAAA